MAEESSYWRKCSSCKKPIRFGKNYWVCSVSTCNRKRSALVFCSVPCWDAHLPIMNHREASTIERTAPSQQENNSTPTAATPPAASKGSAGTTPRANPTQGTSNNNEILVVASKVKDYIKEQSGMNTAASALEALSDRIRQLSNVGIENAKADERKTVMARDIGGIASRAPAQPSSGVVIRRRPG